jgi:hypothetical protein
MRWRPADGHVPRGFAGATGELSEVELVLVSAEPGDPHPEECHTGLHMQSAYDYAMTVLQQGRDLYHKNILRILNMCWPGLRFEQQMRKVWLTDSVLCSAREEGGSVTRPASLTCGLRYLRPQLALFPTALVVALGNKSAARLRQLNNELRQLKSSASPVDFLKVYAVAPPGCNFPGAVPSWQQIPVGLGRRRD